MFALHFHLELWEPYQIFIILFAKVTLESDFISVKISHQEGLSRANVGQGSITAYSNWYFRYQPTWKILLRWSSPAR